MKIRLPLHKEASERAEITVGDHPLVVHVVKDEEERLRGLQGVELGQDEGMLFVFPDVSLRCFALKDVAYPLDVAFLGATGRINTIRYLDRRNKEACYGIGQYVLETRRGWLKEHGIDVGDYVQLPEQEKRGSQDESVSVKFGSQRPYYGRGAGRGGWLNSPSLAYKAVYNEEPPFLPGKTQHPQKLWRGIPVDEDMKEDILDRLEGIDCIQGRASCAGHGPERPSYYVFRLPPERDEEAEQVAERLRNMGLSSLAEEGREGRPRIVVAKKTWPDKDDWEAFWEQLPGKIQRAVEQRNEQTKTSSQDESSTGLRIEFMKEAQKQNNSRDSTSFPLKNPYQQLRDKRITPRWGIEQVYGDRSDAVLRRAREYRLNNKELFGINDQVLAGSLGGANWNPFESSLDRELRVLGGGAWRGDKNTLWTGLPGEMTEEQQKRILAEELGHSRQYNRFYPKSKTVNETMSPVRKVREALGVDPEKTPHLRHATKNPAELGQKLADIKRLYLMRNLSERVSTPQQAEDAWEWVYENTKNSLPNMPFNAINPQEVKKRAPDTYNRLLQVLPGLVRSDGQGPGGQVKTSSQDESSNSVLRIEFMKEAQSEKRDAFQRGYGQPGQAAEDVMEGVPTKFNYRMYLGDIYGDWRTDFEPARNRVRQARSRREGALEFLNNPNVDSDSLEGRMVPRSSWLRSANRRYNWGDLGREIPVHPMSKGMWQSYANMSLPSSLYGGTLEYQSLQRNPAVVRPGGFKDVLNDWLTRWDPDPASPSSWLPFTGRYRTPDVSSEEDTSGLKELRSSLQNLRGELQSHLENIREAGGQPRADIYYVPEFLQGVGRREEAEGASPVTLPGRTGEERASQRIKGILGHEALHSTRQPTESQPTNVQEDEWPVLAAGIKHWAETEGEYSFPTELETEEDLRRMHEQARNAVQEFISLYERGKLDPTVYGVMPEILEKGRRTKFQQSEEEMRQELIESLSKYLPYMAERRQGPGQQVKTSSQDENSAGLRIEFMKEAQKQSYPSLFSNTFQSKDQEGDNPYRAGQLEFPLRNPYSMFLRMESPLTPEFGARISYNGQHRPVINAAEDYRSKRETPGWLQPGSLRSDVFSRNIQPTPIHDPSGWTAYRREKRLATPTKRMPQASKEQQKLILAEEMGHMRQLPNEDGSTSSNLPFDVSGPVENAVDYDLVRNSLSQVNTKNLPVYGKPEEIYRRQLERLENPLEAAQKLAAIKRLYLMKNPDKSVSTPEEAGQAWRWVHDYTKKNPGKLFLPGFPLFGVDPERLKKEDPETYKHFINALPGLVRRNERRPGQTKTSSQDESLKSGLRINFTKEAQDAPGLPSREEYGDLSQLERLVGQQTPYVEQLHRAEDAGEHRDFRVQTPQGLLSWALPKRLPEEPGRARLALQQPLHSRDYADFEGTIESGYGAGEVETARKGNLIVTNVHKDDDGQVQQIDFSLVEGQQPERYSLRKSDDDWLMINVSPSEAPDHEKRHFRRVDEPEKVDELIQQVTEDRPASAKIDGALNLLKFMDDQAEILSHRTSKKTDGPIVHTELLQPSMRTPQDIPEELRGKTLEGEVYFETPEGEALPVQEISGLLNKSIGKARKEIEERDLKPRMALFDALPRDMSEEKKQRLMDKVQELYPELITQPPEVTSEEEARQLKEEVEAGEHPLTEEGLVFRDGRPSKWKTTTETDVIASGFTPGQGKYEDEGIGAIKYKMRPEQEEPTGQVGTGISDELRRQMHEHPEDFLGRVLRLKAQGRFPSGALRAPRLLSLHEDYPSKKDGETEWGPDIEERMEKGSNLHIRITS